MKVSSILYKHKILIRLFYYVWVLASWIKVIKYRIVIVLVSLSQIVLSVGGVADKCVKTTALVKINDKIRMRNLIKPATNFNLNLNMQAEHNHTFSGKIP